MRIRQSLAKLMFAASLVAAATFALADSAVMKLNAFPSVSVADGRSTVTIAAEIRDTNGSLVANGTQITFSATLGASFREHTVLARNGVAHAVMIAGSIPGTVKVTANALAYNATTTLEYELVADRSLLSTAKEYVEIVAPHRLVYSMDQQTIGATSNEEEKAFLRYREIEITADALQLNVPTYELRARKARLKMGKVEKEFDDLYPKLNSRSGLGTTIYTGHNLSMMPIAGALVPRVEKAVRYGIVAITASGTRPPDSPPDSSTFQFADLAETETTIMAKKAVAFPRRNIQFHKAEIYMAEAKVMAIPLFEVSLYGNTPLLTEQVINMNDSQLAVNYPHYLSLKPGETSLLRLTTGESYGRGYGVNRGMFLNYELNWNRGDDMEGGLVFSGLNRSDWGIGARHFMRIDDRTTANAQLDFPAHKSVFGTASISRNFDGFSMSLNGSSTRSLRGAPFSSQNYSFIAEKDPTKVGKLPLRFFFGVTASSLSNQYEYRDPATNQLVTNSTSQQSAGVRARLQLQPITLDSATNLSGSFLVSKLYGKNTLSGLGFMGDLSLRRTLGREASVSVGYNYTEDGYANRFTGRQSVSAQAYYGKGRTTFSAFANRSLDLDRFNYFVDASYRLSSIWRLRYAYTYSRYLSGGFMDYEVTLGYVFGGREFGLTWSNRTKRFALQVLGAAID